MCALTSFVKSCEAHLRNEWRHRRPLEDGKVSVSGREQRMGGVGVRGARDLKGSELTIDTSYFSPPLDPFLKPAFKE